MVLLLSFLVVDCVNVLARLGVVCWKESRHICLSQSIFSVLCNKEYFNQSSLDV